MAVGVSRELSRIITGKRASPSFWSFSSLKSLLRKDSSDQQCILALHPPNKHTTKSTSIDLKDLEIKV
ncbi:MAG: hypothetical protein ACTSWC_07585 [Promethearchaeota archaeon]